MTPGQPPRPATNPAGVKRTRFGWKRIILAGTLAMLLVCAAAWLVPRHGIETQQVVRSGQVRSVLGNSVKAGPTGEVFTGADGWDGSRIYRPARRWASPATNTGMVSSEGSWQHLCIRRETRSPGMIRSIGHRLGTRHGGSRVGLIWWERCVTPEPAAVGSSGGLIVIPFSSSTIVRWMPWERRTRSRR
jgi:hypothetical protein